MLSRLRSLLSWLQRDLFALPTPLYVLTGLLGLGVSFGISYGLRAPDGLASLAQLLGLLGSSRLFYTRLARLVWWVSSASALVGVLYSAGTSLALLVF